ncbi:unnamed protein product [Trichogramma brassicae]|uniref:Reverse transcriptase domain-containing protein n=1 Tax=Trichogramma brassicae TaxID=86971 RepID=A0A6H5J4M1_9HYME|nr:unnamed protein product [Trichogramma brassicae]
MTSPSDLVDSLSAAVTAELDVFAPFITRPFRRPSAPWMTDVLRSECRARDRLFREARRLGSVDLMRRYRIFRRDLKERISRARTDYLSRSLEEQPDQAAVWRLLERHGVTASRSSSAVGRFTLAELNDYNRGVASVHQPCTRDQLIAIMEHTPIEVESRFSFSQVTATEINSVYSDVRRRSRGRSSDGLPLPYLDRIWTVLLPYLVRLFNFCLSSGVYPDAWKRAFIVPLNKIASPASPADTRPIVNLPHLAKIFDRLFTRQMLDYMESNELLLPNQFGFRSGHTMRSPGRLNSRRRKRLVKFTFFAAKSKPSSKNGGRSDKHTFLQRPKRALLPVDLSMTKLESAKFTEIRFAQAHRTKGKTAAASVVEHVQVSCTGPGVKLNRTRSPI